MSDGSAMQAGLVIVAAVAPMFMLIIQVAPRVMLALGVNPAEPVFADGNGGSEQND